MVNICMKLLTRKASQTYSSFFHRLLETKSRFTKMAGALSNLKLEIKSLANTFDQKHPRFQVIAALDEITCKFISDNNNSIEFKANLSVSFDLTMI